MKRVIITDLKRIKSYLDNKTSSAWSQGVIRKDKSMGEEGNLYQLAVFNPSFAGDSQTQFVCSMARYRLVSGDM